MSVPGATRSGLIRLSSQGPRLLNAATPWGSPEILSLAMGGSGNSWGHPCPQVRPDRPPAVRLLRLAPTVSAFLLDPGEPIDNQSTNPTLLFSRSAACPSLPAENTTSMSRWEATNSSMSVASPVYIDRTAEPQLLLWIRTPCWYASSNRSPRLTGRPPSPPCASR